ncbi:hypothetical protein THAOC_14450, partial [Thalassiosira oceanica]
PPIELHFGQVSAASESFGRNVLDLRADADACPELRGSDRRVSAPPPVRVRRPGGGGLLLGRRRPAAPAGHHERRRRNPRPLREGLRAARRPPRLARRGGPHGDGGGSRRRRPVLPPAAVVHHGARGDIRPDGRARGGAEAGPRGAFLRRDGGAEVDGGAEAAVAPTLRRRGERGRVEDRRGRRPGPGARADLRGRLRADGPRRRRGGDEAGAAVGLLPQAARRRPRAQARRGRLLRDVPRERAGRRGDGGGAAADDPAVRVAGGRVRELEPRQDRLLPDQGREGERRQASTEEVRHRQVGDGVPVRRRQRPADGRGVRQRPDAPEPHVPQRQEGRGGESRLVPAQDDRAGGVRDGGVPRGTARAARVRAAEGGGCRDSNGGGGRCPATPRQSSLKRGGVREVAAAVCIRPKQSLSLLLVGVEQPSGQFACKAKKMRTNIAEVDRLGLNQPGGFLIEIYSNRC